MNDDRVVEVEGSPFCSYVETDRSYSLDQVKLLVPVETLTFYAAGTNYPEHVTWAAQKLGREPQIPTKADIGYRAVNAIIAHDEDIVRPKDATDLHYEGELVAVIGKKAKNLSYDEALDCVLGYTIGNDVSERAWQREDRTLWRAKNTDTFKPMAPWIATGLDPTRPGDYRTAQWQGHVPVQHRHDDIRHSHIHFRDEQIPDPLPRRRGLDGH